jgi:hypothetical protein
MYCANLRPEDFQFFSLGNLGIEKAKKDSGLQRGGWTFLSAVRMDGEKRAVFATGHSHFIGTWARHPRSLRGEPGVGKTGIVEGFAQLLAEGKLPDALGRPAVIEIFLTSRVGRKG